MIKDSELISVRNRVNGSVGYKLDGNFHRTFEAGETKKVPFKELRELQYAPGGEYALNNLLVVENQEALDELNMKTEPEYFYKEEDIRKLLFESDNIDAFADFLDFAPVGAIEIAKELAIKDRVPDVRKRELLSKKTGLNIDNAIKVNEIMDAEDEKKEAPAKERRVKVEEPKEESPKRRTSVPKYNVVTKK